jgi:alpha-amylase
MDTGRMTCTGVKLLTETICMTLIQPYSLNEHFGTSAVLSALSEALHNRGMYLMLDVVTNHLAWEGAPDTVDYSSFVPFNSSSYFHPYCSIDYNNATSILDCWEGDTTVGLVDLKTESPAVESIFNTWIKNLVTQYNIDGIRLDSYQQTGIAPAASFQSAAGVFVMGEVFDGSASKVCSYQQPGGMSVLNYPTYFWITRAFQSSSGSMADLANGLLSMGAACDTTLTGSFMENHVRPSFCPPFSPVFSCPTSFLPSTPREIGRKDSR